ncbi:MAG: pyridoxal phosphate-dependent aminotransferase [Muribaculaceae bacterium]|nr:pyridoxal phosphate-dependent aminotransferase [Muribaculaceae bacterium]
MKTKFDFDTPVNRRNTDSLKWDDCPDCEVLPLWVADMDFRTSPAIIDAIEKRAAHGIFGYTHPGKVYYQAVRDWFNRRHNWDIPSENIIYTTGVVPATSSVIKGLTKPGDGVVIMTPVYNCFYSSIRNNECQTIGSPLIIENGLYKIDFSDLENKLALPEAKILLLCNPHNPGGRVWTKEELAHVNELCVKHNIIVLSDEIHNEIVMPGYKYTPFAHVATGEYVSMVSASKSFNTAGLHIANIVTPFEQLREKIKRAVNVNETCDVGPFGVVATIAAYNESEDWLNAMIDYVHENYKYLCNELKEFPQIKVLPLEGSYLAWVDVRALGKPVAEISERLRSQAKVWFTAGTTYGPEGEGYIRINMATAHVTFAEAINRFKKWLKDNI